MKRFLSFVMALMMILSCSALAEEVSKDVLAVVNGENVMVEDAREEYEYYLEYYASYGITDEESLGQLRSDMAEQYARDFAIEQKIAELGIAMPTEEEVAAISEEEYESTTFDLLTTYASEFYTGEGDLDTAVAAFIDYCSTNPEATCAQAIEALSETEKGVMQEAMAGLEAYYMEMGYNMDAIMEYWMQNMQVSALLEYAIADLEITEEEVKAYYDEMVASEEATYAEDPGYLEYLIASGSIEGDPMYVPEGYRYIEHILVLMDTADQNNMYTYTVNYDGYTASIAELEGVTPMEADTYNALDERKDAIEVRMKEIDGLLLNEDADIDGLTTEREGLEIELADINGQLSSDEAKLYGYIRSRDDTAANIEYIKNKYQDKLNNIYERLANGEDFTSLVLELGEDPGMLNETKDAVVPYLVYENSEGVWEENFTQGVMALNEGEYSQEPVWTTYGAHIILYKANVPAGAVPYEDVREKMTQEYTENKQVERYSEMLESWYAEADVTLYPDHLKAE